jgi:hypothetical protein
MTDVNKQRAPSQCRCAATLGSSSVHQCLTVLFICIFLVLKVHRISFVSSLYYDLTSPFHWRLMTLLKTIPNAQSLFMTFDHVVLLPPCL